MSRFSTLREAIVALETAENAIHRAWLAQRGSQVSDRIRAQRKKVRDAAEILMGMLALEERAELESAKRMSDA